jgi:formylglycine-generating enzyme required for sulfatase activity
VLPATPGHLGLAKNAAALTQQLPSFRDCGDCPEMVMPPAGEFMMGSPDSKRGHLDVEGPPRPVVIPMRIAIGKFEVTFDQFSLVLFVAETKKCGWAPFALLALLIDFYTLSRLPESRHGVSKMPASCDGSHLPAQQRVAWNQAGATCSLARCWRTRNKDHLKIILSGFSNPYVLYQT